MIEGVNQGQTLVEETLGFGALGCDDMVVVAQTRQNRRRFVRRGHRMLLGYGKAAEQQQCEQPHRSRWPHKRSLPQCAHVWEGAHMRRRPIREKKLVKRNWLQLWPGRVYATGNRDAETGIPDYFWVIALRAGL